MKIRLLVIALAVTAIATTGFAQLSMAKADWARGPVQFIMTPEEKAQWNAVKNDAEADKFIALFWARRDPTPGTPKNEFQEQFEQKVEYADKTFAASRQRGALSDRGKILLLFGAPNRPVVRTGGGGAFGQPGGRPSAGIGSETEDQNLERQTWTYDGDLAQKLFNTTHVEFVFVDRMGNRDLKLDQPRIDVNAAQQRVVAASITQPNLTELPTHQAQRPAAQPVPAAPAAPVTTFKTASLETAVTDAKAGKIGSKGAMATYAEFISPAGDYFIPVGLYVPQSAGVTADSADTFFGAAEDATGKRVAAFEEPAKLIASKESFFADKTLDLPSGKYTVTVGLAKAGAPLLVATTPVEVTTLTKESTGTSKLIISNDIQTTTAQAPIKSPFAFGQLVIIPKADFLFTNKDDLNYFIELHNPGIDPTTNAPKLQMKMELLDAKGQPVAGAPLADVQAAALSGQPGMGEYAIVNGIPLPQLSKPLKPGEYTLKMKIVDTVSKQSYNLEQKFKITA